MYSNDALNDELKLDEKFFCDQLDSIFYLARYFNNLSLGNYRIKV